MGDRVSISFKNGENESVTLFSHWGGQELVNTANEYVHELKKEVGDSQCMPLERLEPETVMVDFIRYITEGEGRIMSNLYLGVDPNDGDNGDNGHFTIRLDKEAKPSYVG